jgi:hypothetical protein
MNELNQDQEQNLLEVFPDAKIEYDNEGQIIIYTGMYKAVPYKEDEYQPIPFPEFFERFDVGGEG